jgi:hypothetical protein
MRRDWHRLHLIAGVMALIVLMGAPGSSPAAQPGQPGLVITAEPGSVPVGGTFRLVLAYTLPRGAKMGSSPDIRGIEGLSVINREAADGRIVLSVVADSLDPMKVGPVTLGYIAADGRKAFLSAAAVTVKVASNVKGQGDPAPIKGIIPTRNLWLRWGMIAGIAFLVIAAIAGVLWALMRWRPGGGAHASADPPHVRAEKELTALLKENLFEQGRQKEFYFRFTEIVKRYLEALRGFPAAESTTEEIAARITDADRPVLSILRFADLVKFADGTASPGRKDDDVNAFLAYLDVTSPRAAIAVGPFGVNGKAAEGAS